MRILRPHYIGFFLGLCLVCACAAFAAAANGAHGPADCGGDLTPADRLHCENVQQDAADKALGRIFAVLMDSVDKDARVMLDDAQRGWLAYREANFGIFSSAASARGQQGLVEQVRAMRLMTEARVRELENLYRLLRDGGLLMPGEGGTANADAQPRPEPIPQGEGGDDLQAANATAQARARVKAAVEAAAVRQSLEDDTKASEIAMAGVAYSDESSDEVGEDSTAAVDSAEDKAGVPNPDAGLTADKNGALSPKAEEGQRDARADADNATHGAPALRTAVADKVVRIPVEQPKAAAPEVQGGAGGGSGAVAVEVGAQKREAADKKKNAGPTAREAAEPVPPASATKSDAHAVMPEPAASARPKTPALPEEAAVPDEGSPSNGGSSVAAASKKPLPVPATQSRAANESRPASLAKPAPAPPAAAGQPAPKPAASKSVPAKMVPPAAIKSQKGLEMLLGEHDLRLQWLSSAPLGRVVVRRFGDALLLSGRQGVDGDQMVLEGYISTVRKDNFTFRGTLTTHVSFLNGGKPCVREGTMWFVRKAGRPFWRLQSITNPCSGVSDYVDISVAKAAAAQ